MEKFDDFLKEKGSDLPKCADTATRLRMLHGFKFDHEKALKKLFELEEFTNKYLPPCPGAHVKEMLDFGCVYIHGRDHSHRPYVVMNAPRLA